MVVEEGVCPKVFIGSGAIIERESVYLTMAFIKKNDTFWSKFIGEGCLIYY